MMRALVATMCGLCVLTQIFAAAQSADPVGKAAFNRTCAACHGSDGQGGAAPGIVPLDKDVAEVIAIVREGIGEMPPIGPATLTDEEVLAVVTYLKSASKVARRDDRFTDGR
jgi:mono/diheme cytochrome c family protein